MADRRRRRRRRRKQKKGGNIFSTIILIIALVVFVISGYQLYQILGGYYQGQKEYKEITKMAIDVDDGHGFWVNFEELLAINPDTVGWIRFDPEPKQINYPLVQTNNNSTYLNKTFSANENTVGAIFVNCDNKPDFSDRNTIIYGHRMKDNSMFHDLAKYQEKSFWEDNQYFYIYTVDGRELTYHIYSAGVVDELSDAYLVQFDVDEDFQKFIDFSKASSAYDTGVEVTVNDNVVTLSTCTKNSNNERMVVQGVKTAERKMEKK